jgi:hypothetical protein
MMKGFEDLKYAIMKENEKRRKTKEEQMREAEMKLESL